MPLEHCKELQKHFLTLKEQLIELITDLKKDALIKEGHDKRLNILIHKLHESDLPWEKRDESFNLFPNFMKDGLKIEDLTSIAVVDTHHL